jgi:hypothetical protein
MRINVPLECGSSGFHSQPCIADGCSEKPIPRLRYLADGVSEADNSFGVQPRSNGELLSHLPPYLAG